MARNLNKLDSIARWMNKYRPWIYKTKSLEHENHNNFLVKKNQFNFILMSYNILSDDYMTKCPDLYTLCPPKVLKWPERGERILNEIEIDNPDILCLQEVHADHYTDLYSPELEKKGYDSIFYQRDLRSDGSAMFYKKSKFNLLKSKEVNLQREDLIKILDRANVGIIATFEPVKTPSTQVDNRFVVGTTHIVYQPNRGDP